MAACCCASSPRLFYSYRSSSSSPSRSRRRARLIVYPPSAVVAVAPAPRLSWRTLASPDPPPLADDRDDAIGFQIQVSKVGRRNRRVVRARVRVDAPLEAVWATLTDYEGLADFIPGLSECRLLDQAHGFARIYQVGEQDLALGFKFNAKGTIDCYEGDMESLPAESGGARRREIAFNMIDGDFKLFRGKWSVVQEQHHQGQAGPPADSDSDSDSSYHYHTTLSYLVELEPKLWVPVRLLEGRICSEIKNNLVSIRERAQQQQQHHEVTRS